MDEMLNQIEAMRGRCPEGRCPALDAVKEEIEAGDWAGALRQLTTRLGICGTNPEGCVAGGWELKNRLVQDEKERLREMWATAFQGKPLEIDFVCVNPTKLRALREAMTVADVVPLTFALTPHPDGRTDRLRVVVSL